MQVLEVLEKYQMALQDVHNWSLLITYENTGHRRFFSYSGNDSLPAPVEL